jgi:serine phosphatase RsbU (regulator of sigma subunit)
VRVLVVDDHPLNVELLAVNLQRLGYEVVQAESGQAALQLIESNEELDLVLMDVLMPDLSGLEVLRTIRGQPGTDDLPVILVSGLGDTEDIVEGLKLGANDYVTKPINMPVLKARLATHTALKRARDALKQTAELLASELDRQARELRVAAHVQRSILPRKPPECPGVRTAWRYEPATEVGGDLFDVLLMPGGRTFLFLADAMGHGVHAALVASTVKAALSAHLAEADDLAMLMRHLDEAVGSLFEDRFVTAAACIIDPASHTLRYVLAGHPPILVYDRGGVRQLRTGGLPLGTLGGLDFIESEVELEPGSRILLYSDGVTEAEGPGGDQLGVSGLADLLAQLSEEEPGVMVEGLRAFLDEHRGSVPLADDLTILMAQLS